MKQYAELFCRLLEYVSPFTPDLHIYKSRWKDQRIVVELAHAFGMPAMPTKAIRSSFERVASREDSPARNGRSSTAACRGEAAKAGFADTSRKTTLGWVGRRPAT